MWFGLGAGFRPWRDNVCVGISKGVHFSGCLVSGDDDECAGRCCSTDRGHSSTIKALLGHRRRQVASSRRHNQPQQSACCGEQRPRSNVTRRFYYDWHRAIMAPPLVSGFAHQFRQAEVNASHRLPKKSSDHEPNEQEKEPSQALELTNRKRIPTSTQKSKVRTMGPMTGRDV